MSDIEFTIITVILAILLVIFVASMFALALAKSAGDADEQTHKAFLKMLEEEKTVWKYDLTETTTSGCPVENNK